jgi:putative membrane protein
MMGSGTGMGWSMGWGWVFGALVVVGVVALVVLAVRAIGGGVSSRPSTPGPADGAPPGPGRARELLDERYARGELTTEEYQERLRALGENR